MKIRILLLAACVFLMGSALAADLPSVKSLNSLQAPRVLSASALVDYWQITDSAGYKEGKLVSLFGYNAGAAGFVELFNTASTNPVIRLTGFDSVNGWWTNAVANVLATGDAVQFTNTIGGQTAAIYWVFQINSNTFYLASTYAKAKAIVPDILPTGASAAGNINLVPIHSFKVAATDNYSFVVPTTGMPYGRGLLIATSTTGGTYTVGGTNITALVTVGSP